MTESNAAAPGAPPGAGEAAGPDEFLCLDREKVSGKGEDAPAYSAPCGPDRAAGVVAVFDGLGGAGSAEVDTPHGRQTQARLAARITRDAMLQSLSAAPAVPEPAYPGEPYPAVARELAEAVRSRLLAEAERYGLGAGRIRSKMIRTLPTTLAVGRYGRTSEARARVEAIWAGDSRVYLLTPGAGLQQLTEDDVRSRGDALANIREDSPMTNVVNASSPFQLNVRTIEELPTPFVLLAATDGCFGYLPTPWHFEHLLLDALADAKDGERWKLEIEKRIAQVAGDDVSMGIALVGVGAFSHLKSNLKSRHRHLAEAVKSYDGKRKRFQELAREHAKLKSEFGALESEQWTWYREGYEYPLRSVERREAIPRDPGDLMAPAGPPEPADSKAKSGPEAAAGERCHHCGHPLVREGAHR